MISLFVIAVQINSKLIHFMRSEEVLSSKLIFIYFRTVTYLFILYWSTHFINMKFSLKLWKNF